MNSLSNAAFASELGVIKFPKSKSFYGFDANGKVTLPEGISMKHRLRGAWLEAELRIRTACKGFVRGITKGEGILGVGRLYASVVRANGVVDHLGLLSTRVITDAGVTFLRDDWNNSGTDVTNLNFHGAGTGTATESTADTQLGAEITTGLTPDSTRATGTKSTPASNQLRSIGTLNFDATAAVTEHGLFSQAATGGGTLWDRSVFAAINVANGDSIQFTYTCTINSGG